MLFQQQEQLEQNGEHRLVEQIDDQGVAACPLQKPQKGGLAADTGQQALLFGVQDPSQHPAQQEKAKVWQQREVVRRDESPGDDAQRDQPGKIHPDVGIQPQTRRRYGNAGCGQCPGGQLTDQRPAQHADAQAVQNAEIDDHAFVRHAGKVHPGGNGGAEHAAGENDASPADATAAQRGADAGNQQKQHTAPVLQEGKGGGQLPGNQPIQLRQVENEVDGYHAQDADPPGGIQLPDAFFHGDTS